MKVLIVEDERKISDVVSAYLRREGYDVIVAGSGGDALKALTEKPDLIILDLMLPDMDGEDICRAIREHSNTPIIMLTAKSQEESKVAGLMMGADDYVVKPFSPRELMARVTALIRRCGPKSDTLRFGGGTLTINKDTGAVTAGGKLLKLTPTEFKLLVALAENPGRTLSRAQLINLVQGYDFDGIDRTVDAHVKNLRRKMGPIADSVIQTVYSTGYVFRLEPDES